MIVVVVVLNSQSFQIIFDSAVPVAIGGQRIAVGKLALDQVLLKNQDQFHFEVIVSTIIVLLNAQILTKLFEGFHDYFSVIAAS